MTDDLDQLLGRLAARPPHPRLDTISAYVFARIAESPVQARGSFAAIGVLAALFAVGMGVAGGWSPPPEAHRAVALDAGHALAPSTLLGGG